MKTLRIALVAISLLGAGTLANAQDLRTVQNNMRNGITTVEQNYRDKLCPSQPIQEVKEACEAAYNMAIARTRASIAELELRAKAGAVKDPVLRAKILALVPEGEYSWDNITTQTRSNGVDHIFSVIWRLSRVQAQE